MVPGQPDRDQQRQSKGGNGEKRPTGRDRDNGDYPTGEPWDKSYKSDAQPGPPGPDVKYKPPKAGEFDRSYCQSIGYKDPSCKRSARNNNPGAIMGGPGYKKAYGVVGADGGNGSMTTFITPAYGFAAQTEILDRYRGNGKKTLRQITHTYAPYPDNNPDQYAETWGKKIGVDPDREITDEEWNDPEFRFRLQKAQAEIEGGYDFNKLYDDKDLVDGLKMRGYEDKKEQNVGDEAKPGSNNGSRPLRMPSK